MRDMASAGAIVSVGDPVIDWFRDRMGAPRPPEVETDTGFDEPPGTQQPPGGDPNNNDPDEDDLDEGEKE